MDRPTGGPHDAVAGGGERARRADDPTMRAPNSRTRGVSEAQTDGVGSSGERSRSPFLGNVAVSAVEQGNTGHFDTGPITTSLGWHYSSRTSPLGSTHVRPHAEFRGALLRFV